MENFRETALYLKHCHQMKIHLSPYIIIADDASPLKEHIMKSYGLCNFILYQIILNYHLSKAKRIVEIYLEFLLTFVKFVIAHVNISTK